MPSSDLPAPMPYSHSLWVGRASRKKACRCRTNASLICLMRASGASLILASTRSLQDRLAPNRMVFIDETWIKTNIAPLRGWGSKGERLRGFAPHGHWRTLTFLGALRSDQLTAPCVFDGPINDESSRAYVEQQLFTVLNPGDIVVMDNLGSHKWPTVRHMIRKAGARLWYLLPYSPDLNPIERVFAKIKHWMRIAQKRTIDDACDHIGHLVRSVLLGECSNYFVNAGYVSIKK